MKRYDSYKDSGVKWIGEIPSHWKIMRTKNIATSFSKGNGITKDDIFEDGDTPCIRYGEIYSKYKETFQKCLSHTILSIQKSPRYIHCGDIVFAGTGELVEEIGKNIVYTGNDDCLAGGDIIIMRHKQNPIFLNFALNSDYAQAQKSDGKAKLKVVHISASEIGNVYLAVPPLPEQRAIVSFLETELGKIDTYMDKEQQLIERLKELKQSLIAHAVTHGIDPNVKMKLSGINWIGEIPEHWKTRKIKNIFRERSVKGYPNEPVLCATQKYGVIPQNMYENRVVVVNKGLEGLKLVRKGDFVISLRSFQGGIEYAHYQGIISAAYTVLNLSPAVNAQFMTYLLKSFDFIQLLKTCVTGIREGQNINYGMLKKNSIALPPASEQHAIVDYLQNKTSKIDKLITEKTREMEYMKELRQRIISDAVTGKIDVRS